MTWDNQHLAKNRLCPVYNFGLEKIVAGLKLVNIIIK